MKPHNQISLVSQKLGLTGRKHVVTVGNKDHEFDTERAAWEFRSEQVRKRERGRQFDYDPTDDYISVSVAPPPLEDERNSLFGWFGKENTGLGVHVDAEALEQGVQHACARISLDGYEILAITPLTSGIGAWRMNHEGVAGASAGWGFSFTQGVLITARKAG